MAWVMLDDNFTEDPVLERAGVDAAWLHIAGLCYSNRLLTDGYIPADRVPRLTNLPEPERLADRLVELGIWDRVAPGYLIVHHLDRQKTRAEVEKLRADRAAAGRRGGQRSGRARRSKREASAEANAQPIVEAKPQAKGFNPSPLLLKQGGGAGLPSAPAHPAQLPDVCPHGEERGPRYCGLCKNAAGLAAGPRRSAQ